MSSRGSILKILADGAFHSGTDIGRALGVSRAAVNKCIKSLTEMGLEVHRVSGRGYRLGEPCVPLDRQEIAGHLGPEGSQAAVALHIEEEIDSTNGYLLRLAETGSVSGHVCVAESQTRGRGRRGRDWLATPYHNIMLSIAWQLQAGAAAISGLSLAAGVAIVRALRDCGVAGVGLKWPNDLIWQERKLGGVLVDIRGEATGPCLVVLGAGVNVKLRHREADGIGRPWVDLRAIAGDTPDRNRLAGLMVRHLAAMFRQFEQEGFAAFWPEWERLHVHAGKPVRLLVAEGEVHGHAEGVDRNGGLLLRDAAGKQKVFHAGEVSLRQAS